MAAVLMAAAACGAPRTEPPPRTGQAEPGAERRRWTPSNAQAATIGAVSVGREIAGEAGAPATVTFAFAAGVTVRAAAIDKDAASAEFGADVAALQSILGAPPDVRPWLYRVTRETVALSAGDGGLCGGLRTTHLIAAEFVDAENEWTLRIASLHRPPAGEGAARPAHHCFSFDFRL
jgi:hypothetical protein